MRIYKAVISKNKYPAYASLQMAGSVSSKMNISGSSYQKNITLRQEVKEGKIHDERFLLQQHLPGTIQSEKLNQGRDMFLSLWQKNMPLVLFHPLPKFISVITSRLETNFSEDPFSKK